jgi:hypothetical protein
MYSYTVPYQERHAMPTSLFFPSLFIRTCLALSLTCRYVGVSIRISPQAGPEDEGSWWSWGVGCVMCHVAMGRMSCRIPCLMSDVEGSGGRLQLPPLCRLSRRPPSSSYSSSRRGHTHTHTVSIHVYRISPNTGRDLDYLMADLTMYLHTFLCLW